MHDNRAIASGVVIVPDKSKIIQRNGQPNEVGAAVFWNSGQTRHAVLCKAWDDAGLPEALKPSLPSPEVALRRGLRAMQENRLMVRPLARRGKWAIVRETVDEASATPLEYELEAQVRLNDIKQLVIEPATLDPEFRQEIETMYQHQLGMLAAEDVTQWLVNLTNYCGAAKLKKGGGLYFIPPHTLDMWRRMVDVIVESSDCVIEDLPMGRSTNVAKAVLNGLTHEAQTAADEMEAELLEGDLGARALRSRAERCEAELARITAFEPVVGDAVHRICDAINTLKSRLSAAALAAMADD